MSSTVVRIGRHGQLVVKRTLTVCSWTARLPYTPAAAGTITVDVEARDLAGNGATASHSIIPSGGA